MISPAARSLLAVPLLLAVSWMTPWGTPALAAVDASQAKVTGSAIYRERIALTGNAVFEARLEDVSRADAPAEVIAQVTRNHPGQVPIAFEIAYDPRRIDAGRKYVVRASISEDGRLRFASDQAYPVLTHGHGKQVKILLRGVAAGPEAGQGWNRGEPEHPLGALPATYAGLLPCADCAGIRTQINVLAGGAYMKRMTYLRDGHDASYYEVGAWSLSRDGRTLTLGGGEQKSAWAVVESRTIRKLDLAGKPIDSKLPYDLTRASEMQPIEPRLKLSGMFRYMADAARFRDCGSGLEWPVAMSDDYRALERAYAERRTSPGSELLVSLRGRVEPRAKMEGRGTEPTLVVEKLLRATPGGTCEEPGEHESAPGLAYNRWRPIRIGDRDVVVSGQQREPWIELDARSQQVTGSGGCNRISGGYEAGDGTLRVGPLVSTKMACPEMEIESAFLHALDATRRYRIRGRVLELMDDRGKLLARLEERNL